MSEHIAGIDVFASGGHRWSWGPRRQEVKRLATVGVTGVGRMLLANCERVCQITDAEGGPALLQAEEATRLLADRALDLVEYAITNLMQSASENSWEDDTGRTGGHLVVADYQPQGPRHYGVSGGKVTAMQYYRCTLIDLAGDW
jgi:hypothetical protein